MPKISRKIRHTSRKILYKSKKIASYDYERYLRNKLKTVINNKMILVIGPRQVGKTTLSKSICSNYEYLNFDSASHRKKIKEEIDFLICKNSLSR